jgi:hypothetical protein
MEAKCINQIDNIVTFEIMDNYEFQDQERVNITILKNTFADELRALYWILLEWVVKNKLYMSIPGAEKWFNPAMSDALALEKLYCFIRYQTGWTEITWDRDGMKRIYPKSTGKKMNQKDRQDNYEKTYNYFSQYIDMTEFERQHTAARREIGKD